MKYYANFLNNTIKHLPFWKSFDGLFYTLKKGKSKDTFLLINSRPKFEQEILLRKEENYKKDKKLLWLLFGREFFVYLGILAILILGLFSTFVIYTDMLLIFSGLLIIGCILLYLRFFKLLLGYTLISIIVFEFILFFLASPDEFWFSSFYYALIYFGLFYIIPFVFIKYDLIKKDKADFYWVDEEKAFLLIFLKKDEIKESQVIERREIFLRNYNKKSKAEKIDDEEYE